MGFTGNEPLEIVGESRYQAGIRRIVDKHRDSGELTLMALLIAEPLNPFDRNAVRVDLLLDRERETGGYLSREQARVHHQLVCAAMDMGALPLMLANAYGGSDDKPNFGIWLRSFAPDPTLQDATAELTERSIERTKERRRWSLRRDR